LRRVKPTDLSDRCGLWLSRAGVLIEKLHPFNGVRDRVNEMFGVRKPTLIEGLRMTFTPEKKKF